MAKGSGSGSGFVGAVGGSVLAQGAGIGAIGCKPEDKSFYCRSSRFVMVIKNLIFLALLLALVIYLFNHRKDFMGKK
jgi:hypothetical protein